MTFITATIYIGTTFAFSFRPFYIACFTFSFTFYCLISFNRKAAFPFTLRCKILTFKTIFFIRCKKSILFTDSILCIYLFILNFIIIYITIILVFFCYIIHNILTYISLIIFTIKWDISSRTFSAIIF